MQKAQNHTQIEEPKLQRKRNRLDYSILQYMEGYGQGAPANHPQRVDDHYRILYYEAIDVVVAAIKDRFNQHSYKTFAALETMLLNLIRD